MAKDAKALPLEELTPAAYKRRRPERPHGSGAGGSPASLMGHDAPRAHLLRDACVHLRTADRNPNMASPYVRRGRCSLHMASSYVRRG